MLPARCAGPIYRRAFVQVGALGLGGAFGVGNLSQADVLAGRAAAGNASLDTAVIVLYLHGGASQLETYDLKPQAPAEYRSVFRPIATNVPGLEICEHFPRQARLADKIALVRSVHHTMSSHSDGGIEVLTGKTPTRPDPTSTSHSEHPDFGHVASRVRGMHPNALPRYVGIPGPQYMTRPTYLGLHHSAFASGDPSNAGYAPPHLTLARGVNGLRLDDRSGLLDRFDRLRGELDQHGSLAGTDQFREQALRMLTSPRTAGAFDIAREEPRLRDRYGRDRWGQACLLARRLAEAGTAVVNLAFNTPHDGPEWTNWDDHIQNAGRPGHFGGFMERRLPYLDQCLSALIEDIHDRGLDRRILVLVMGEFGRTPRLSRNQFGVGRDHWPAAQTVLFAGGGLRMGQAIGATNGKAEYPAERPYTPKDVLATVYRHLGVDFRQAFIDHSGRPIHILEEGRPIAELV
jgi:hypothetical protein